MLTETQIRALKPKDRPYKVGDERGLYLLVNPTGSRLWRLKYYVASVCKSPIALGAWPDVPLVLARKRRDHARELAADGIDPAEARKAEKLARADTFKAIAQEWIEQQAKTLSANTIDIERARLTSTLYPAFGSKPISSIKAPALLAVLRRVEANGNHETAHRLYRLYGRVERFAIATGSLERGITPDLKGALTPVKAKHFAAITEPRQIGQLLRAIDGYVGQPAAMYALKLAPHVFVRPGELRGARWAEFDLDSKTPVWRIPKERMKMAQEHLVPLSRQVVAMLRQLKGLTGDGELLFPGLRTSARPISDNTLNAALRRVGFTQEQMTAHGFRTTASTSLNELGIAPDIIELQLAHAEQNKTRAAYNRATRLQQRRRMMQKYSNYLDNLRAAKNSSAGGVA